MLAFLNNRQPAYPWDAYSTDKDMSLTEHLQELRRCLLRSLEAWAACSAFCFYHVQAIVDMLTAAAGNLYYMRPAEAFMIYMKLALLGGLLLAAPVILQQMYGFISPALTAREKRFTLMCLPLTLLLALGGMLFSYRFVFPRGLEFFLGFAAGKVNPLLSLESYLEFFLLLVVPFGFIFTLPLIVLLLCYLQLIRIAALQKYRKHIIWAAFIVAAVITPTPDIITQSLLALPMIALYEIGIVLAKIFITAEADKEV